MIKHHRYEKWEDWQNGMYKLECDDSEDLIEQCVDLLKNSDGLIEAMRHVAFNWTCSAEQNMSDPKKNHRSWLGQAACCFELGAPEWVTRLAWGQLLQSEKDAANLVADVVYSEWKGDLFC